MRTKRAFTLIELLVVISVIALLMAILMPALLRAKELGKRILCSSHVKSLGLASVVYADETDGWYVPIIYRPQGAGSTSQVTWPSNQLFRKLIGYVPQDQKGVADSTWHAPKEYRCPSDLVGMQERPDRLYTNFISYSANITDWYYSNWYSFGYAGHKTVTVPQPASRLFFSESNDWWFWWSGANYRKGWDVLGQATIMPYKDLNAGVDGPTLYRHSEGVNMSFYDGHVEYRKKDKVWNDDDWGAGKPGMWSTFNHWPPTDAEQKRLPHP
jgi:prepilin-type N-terminal cleavage/methylation domain-containing protein/prepilin-type processing-associated H-X9-DG protein